MVCPNCGGAVASWLVRLPPDQAARVRGLASNIMLRVLEQFTLFSQCLSVQQSGKFNARGNPAMD